MGNIIITSLLIIKMKKDVRPNQDYINFLSKHG